MNRDMIEKLRKIGKGIRILYVEDEEATSLEILNLLKKIFKQVDFAKDGKDAMLLYEEKKYDLIITDIEMPQLNGIELIQQIKEKDVHQIIMVTSAYNDAQKLMKLIDLGVEKFVLKPINLQKFLLTTSKLIVNIYKNKRAESLQKEVSKKLKLMQMLLEKMLMPVLLLEDNNVKYKNQKYNEVFHIGECLDFEHYKLKDIFLDEELSHLTNEEIIEVLEEKTARKWLLRTAKHKNLHYKIQVSSLDDVNAKLLTYVNIESINKEVQELQDTIRRDHLTGLYTREFFLSELEETLDAEEEYTALCFSIKHIDKYITLYGVKNLRDVYSFCAKSVKHYFQEEHAKQLIKFYYFETNSYVALVKTKDMAKWKKEFSAMDLKFIYSNNAGLKNMNLSFDILYYDLQKEISDTKNMNELDNIIYMLKHPL